MATLSVLRNEVWQQIGEPTDLDPASDVQYGGAPLLNWAVNEGQRQVAFWRDPENGRVFRHPQLLGEMFFETPLLSGVLEDQAAMDDDQILLPWLGYSNNQFDGWVVKVGSEIRFITSYDAGSRVAVLDNDWSSTPATGATVYLYTRGLLMVATGHAWAATNIVMPVVTDRWRSTGNFIEVQKLEDLTSQVELSKAPRTESYLGGTLETGAPTSYYRRGNRLIFDRAPDEVLKMRLEYYRGPTEMIQPTDEPELSEQFHHAMVLWAMAWGFKRSGDNASAYSTNQELNRYMKRVVAHMDIEPDRRVDYGKLRRK